MKKNILGFTLVELMLVLAVIMGMSLLEFQKLKNSSDEAAAAEAGKDLGKVIEALDKYISLRMTAYQDINNTATQPDIFPGVCAPVAGETDMCMLDLSILVREGLMPGGWQPVNRAMRSNYSAYIKRYVPSTIASPIPSDYSLETFVRTDEAWGSGSMINWSMLGSAVRQAGAMAGVVKSDGAHGLFSAWSLGLTDYPGMAEGQLAGVARVHGGMLSKFVRLDGSLAMTNSLNMGNYRLNNVNDIEMTGQSNLPRRAGSVQPMLSHLSPNWVLRGVYNIVDYDSDDSATKANSTVERPICADSDDSSGIPKILIKMTSMYNEMYAGLSDGTPVQPGESQAAQTNRLTSAYGGWNTFALEDLTNNKWQTYIRRFYDNGYIPGEGLAEVYCFYP